jgi:hypothetical protein
MKTEESLLVSIADHEAGYKEMEVTTRTDRRMVVRLTAPTRRKSRGLGLALQADGDPWTVVAACAPKSSEVRDQKSEVGGQGTEVGTLSEGWMDSLTPASADLVESVAFCLTFGLGFQKKMEAGAASVMEKLDSKG